MIEFETAEGKAYVLGRKEVSAIAPMRPPRTDKPVTVLSMKNGPSLFVFGTSVEVAAKIDAGDSRHQEIQKLLEKNQKLEAEIAELRAQIATASPNS